MGDLGTKPYAGVLIKLASVAEPVADAFFAMREVANAAGPLDAKQRELCLLAGFTAARNEGGFRVHCARALEKGATKEEITHVVLLMLGSNLGLSPVVDTLQWVREELG